jgi:hypothetical protein
MGRQTPHAPGWSSPGMIPDRFYFILLPLQTGVVTVQADV